MKTVKEFIAFDVETANSKRESICCIGFVKVKNDRIIKRAQYLIKPQKVEFESHNIAIHGITPEDIIEAYEIDEVWSELVDDFTNHVLVAHNLSFDLTCLKSSLGLYGIEFAPKRDAFCTYRLTNRKLIDLCQSYNIEIDHHDSLSDAIACAQIFRKINNGQDLCNANRRVFKDATHPWQRERIQSDFLKPDFQNADSSSPFFMKKVVITGVFVKHSRNELAQVLKKLGADIDTSVTKRTNFLIAGENMGPAKKEKAEKLGVQVISEDELEQMLNAQ
jgi:DNA polymerase-3 subunit epsilon